nr:hypothetical protein [bacterium]
MPAFKLTRGCTYRDEAYQTTISLYAGIDPDHLSNVTVYGRTNFTKPEEIAKIRKELPEDDPTHWGAVYRVYKGKTRDYTLVSDIKYPRPWKPSPDFNDGVIQTPPKFTPQCTLTWQENGLYYAIVIWGSSFKEEFISRYCDNIVIHSWLDAQP